MQALAQVPQQRLRAVDPALRGEIGKAELEDPRRQRKVSALLLDIAELGERAQHAPRGGARQIRGLGRLRQSHGRLLLAERAEHRQPLGERRHEFLVLGIAVT